MKGQHGETATLFSISSNMPYPLMFSGRRSALSTDSYPPLKLDPNKDYIIGSIDFQTYNSIPNVDETNNKFCYAKNKKN